MKVKSKMRDRDMEIVMGNLLRIGVLLSALIVAVGGIIFLSKHGTQLQHYHFFQSEPRRLRDIGDIWKTALQGRGQSLIQFGLIILIATPIARIAFSIIGYFLEKDYLYMLITLIVLGVIFFSLRSI
jgi:uncharacterized membrane protein